MRTMLLLAALALAPACAQESTPIPPILAGPYPAAADIQSLGSWANSVEEAARDAIRAAQARKDGEAVARILLHLDQARRHGYRELARMQPRSAP